MPRAIFHQIVILLLMAATPAFSADFLDQKREIAFPKQTIEIIRKAGTLKLPVEVATTDEQLQRGLMYREKIDADAGMLFVFPKPQIIHMWMKNTTMPLDMFFIDEQGVIQSIAENTTPLSEALITSTGETKMVLEMAAGSSRNKGIAIGDTIKHETISR